MLSSIPAVNYASKEIFKDEVNKIFKENWLFYCFKTDFDSDKIFIEKEILSIPVFITNIDGVLSAFYNVCPHRGARLVDMGNALGNKTTIVCPYHYWGFSLTDGKSAISRDDLLLKDRACTSLKKIQVEAVGNFIFINLSLDNKQSLSDFLGDLKAELLIASEILDFTQLTSKVIPHKCNWKHLIENVIDNKHCAPVHKNTLAKMGFCKNKPIAEIGSLHNLFTINPANSENSQKKQKLLKLLYKNLDTVDYYKHILIFPNLTLSIFEGVHYTVGYVDPIDEFNTVYYTHYIRPNIPDANLSESIRDSHVDTAIDIFSEDIIMLNSLSDNLFKAGFAGEVYLDEERIVHFMDNYIKQMNK
jgi:phenylpropionate dioxygenase-like ring-hydroxylating dioxygenase large terminal subunit